MACPKFDRNNKKHVIIVASVAAAIVLLVVIAVVLALVLPGSSSSGSSGGGKGKGEPPHGTGREAEPAEDNSDVGGNGLWELGLNLHNKYRQRHHVDPLTISEDLNEKAQKCAKHYAKKGTIDHSCPHKAGAGENLYWRKGTKQRTDEKDVKAAIEGWYKELEDYDFDQGKSKNGKQTGHFTQLVWKESTEIGQGIARNGKQVVVVALYNPHGNVKTLYTANVMPE